MKKNSKVQQKKRVQRTKAAKAVQQTKLEQQMEQQRRRMQQSGEIGGVVGLDVGDKRSWVRLVGLDGEVIHEGKISTRPAAIEKFFRSQPRLRVVLETGTHTNWMRRLIASLGHEVLVADARQLRLISQSYSKNDRNDAYWLAELGRSNPELLRLVEPRSLSSEHYRSWLRGRETLVETRTQLINSLRGLAKSYGIRLGTVGMTKWVEAVGDRCPAVLQTVLQPMAQMIVALTHQINALNKRLEQLGKQQYGATQLLRTADGVGPLTSLAYVLELDNQVRRVKRSRSMGAVVGFRPRQRDSGESAPQLGITKSGNPLLRHLLVQSAQRILGPFGRDSALRRWGFELAARGGKRAKRRAVVAVARKLAVILHAMWVNGEVWQPFPEGEPAAEAAATGS